MRHSVAALRLTLLVSLGILFFSSFTLAQGKVKSGQEIYKETLRATVWVVVPQGAPVEGKLRVTSGSGSLIERTKRIVVTNYHVVGDNPEVFIFFPHFDSKGKLIAERDHYQKQLQKGSIPGKVIAKSPKHDLALIQLASVPEGTRVLPLASGSPSPGQRVYSIGNPGSSGALWVYTSGDVRAVYRKQWKAGGDGRFYDLDAQVVETQSPTNKGDSGGPLVNEQGQLVGVTQGSVAGAQLLSLFIEVSEVKTLLASSKIKVSPAGTAVVVEDRPKPEKKPEATVLSEEQRLEQEAARRLNQARVLADNGKIDLARERYQEIIKNYPKSAAAEEARKLLKK